MHNAVVEIAGRAGQVLEVEAKRVLRISILRPEHMQEKVNPYLRPLYDALYEMLDAEKVQKLMLGEML